MRSENPIREMVEKLLRQHGFKSVGSVWRRDRGEVIQVVHLQRSTRDNYYFLNVGVFAKPVEPDVQPKRIVDCHLQDRDNSLPQVTPVPSHLLLDGTTSQSEDDRLIQFSRFFESSLETYFDVFSSPERLVQFARTPRDKRSYLSLVNRTLHEYV